MKDDDYWNEKRWRQVMGRPLSRRTFLAGVGLAGLGGLSLMAPGAAGATPWPVDPARPLDPRRFPNSRLIWSWQERLAQWCPPFTGSPAHGAYVDWLDRELQAARLRTHRRSFPFSYWEPQGYSLRGLQGREIPVVGYQPYSGETPAWGITAPLHFAGTAPNLSYEGAADKIVVYEAPLAEFPTAAAYPAFGYYPPESQAEMASTELAPTWAFMQAPSLAAAKDAGALGVIRVWTNISDGAAMHQDQPWGSPPAGVPALWVGRNAGQQLKAMAAAQQSVALRLQATVTPNKATDNLWAVLPGQTDETIIINTHSDGCNAFEENGGLGVLALAKYFSRVPLSRRRRTLVFLITTGHFGHGMVPGTATWQTENPDLMERAVACLTLEHLGATEWKDDAEGRYGPTGKVTFGSAFTGLKSMAGVYLESAKEAQADRMVMLDPTGGIYFGEGASFWKAGIPTISYMGSSWYLFTAPPLGEVSKLDRERLYDQIATAAFCVERIDGMSVEEIRGGRQAES